MVASSAQALDGFGFRSLWVSEGVEELYALLRQSAEHALKVGGRPIDTREVAALILYSGIPIVDGGQAKEEHEIFNYVLPRLAYDLDLVASRTYALSQQGCSGLLSSIELARDILISSPGRYVLCVAADRLPTGYRREVIYNVVSDAAGAFLIERNGTKNAILGIHHESNFSLWNTRDMEDQILATYFPMANRAIRQALESHALSASDITWFVPHNVSRRSWEILAGLLSVPLKKVWLENVGRVGHTVSCDHIINLADMEEQEVIKSGDLLFLFTFGFGAEWSSAILRR